MGFMDGWIDGTLCSARFRPSRNFFSNDDRCRGAPLAPMHLHPRSRNQETSDAPVTEYESGSGSTERVGELVVVRAIES